MERCPCCNARLSGAVHCPRCQANLGSIIASEQQAELCLNHATDFWFAQQPQLAIQSLTAALKLKRTITALVFRDFIVQKQSQRVLALLIENKTNEAKQMLYLLHELHPRHELVKQLQSFTDYISNRSNGFNRR